jgi:hypothetical protein
MDPRSAFWREDSPVVTFLLSLILELKGVGAFFLINYIIEVGIILEGTIACGNRHYWVNLLFDILSRMGDANEVGVET